MRDKNRYNILVIDDSPFFNNTITRELKKEGYTVKQAFSLEEGSNLISKENFDYIILDLLLPDGEGEDLVDELPKKERSKIIVLTSDNDTVRRNYLFNAGILDYFSKSTSLYVIINDIKTLIDELEYNPDINVLIIEDSAFSRKMLNNTLNTRKYNVFLAETGKKGLEILTNNNIDLILLDYELPDTNGYEILKKIKKDKRFVNVPVIVISSIDDEEIIAKLLKRGANDFIKKPYSIEHLLLKCSLHIQNYMNVKIIENQRMKLNDSLKKIKKMEKYRNIFFSSISHDLKVPLNSINGFVELLIEKETNPTRLEYLKTIKSSASTLLLLVNDILDFSKIETGKMQTNKEYISLNEFTEEIKSMFAPIVKKKNQEFKITIDKTVPAIIKFDPLRLKQVLVNLIGNATKFTPEKGKIELMIRKMDNKVEFNVIDNGIGIEKDKQKKIFELFSQEDISTEREYGGTGLGLSISSKLVSLLGGELKVESEKGKGSKFFFTIPLETTDKIQNKETKIDATVLLAEDDRATRELMTIVLKKMGMKVETAQNGKEAWEKFRKKTYDIIILDNQMPEMTGLETAKLIRAEEEKLAKEPTPILLITGDIMPQESLKKAGIDDYITKPVNKDKLNYILNNILKKRSIKNELQH